MLNFQTPQERRMREEMKAAEQASPRKTPQERRMREEMKPTEQQAH